jgi:predicted O-linked N-acetylglucosamine transferase (SPINDLY family)
MLSIIKKFLTRKNGHANAYLADFVDYKKQGNDFLAFGSFTQAENCYRQHINVQPDDADGYINLGFVLNKLSHHEEAQTCLLKALALNPREKSDIFYLLGSISHKWGVLEEARDYYNKALSVNQHFAEVYLGLTGVLCMQGFLEEALSCCKQALALAPDRLFVEGTSNFLCLQSTNAYYRWQDYVLEAKKYGEYVAAAATPYTNWQTSLNRDTKKTLKVGLVSGDLHNHPVGYFLDSFISHINQQCVQLMVYETSAENNDDLTKKLQSSCASWVSVVDLNDEEAARRIHEDRIDVLIDLAGHTEHNRLALFAWKPAPVQVTWLGYWASTGVSAIDYVLVDEISLPATYHDQFTEQVWYLPHTRMCFSEPSNSIAVSTLSALNKGYITFGSFQSLIKISDGVLLLWSRVLTAIPTARLRLQMRQLHDDSVQRILRKRLEKAGIALDRVDMNTGVSRPDYLVAHAEVDIILDTFPFTGGTTTCEALWMGVPTLTLVGDTLLGRQGASMLTCAGLSQWVANSADEFVELAVKHVTNIDDLAQLRMQLRQQVLQTPLFDGIAFARQFEEALRGMWEEKSHP